MCGLHSLLHGKHLTFFFFFKQKRETDFVYKGGKIKPGRKSERNRYESS